MVITLNCVLTDGRESWKIGFCFQLTISSCMIGSMSLRFRCLICWNEGAELKAGVNSLIHNARTICSQTLLRPGWYILALPSWDRHKSQAVESPDSKTSVNVMEVLAAMGPLETPPSNSLLVGFMMWYAHYTCNPDHTPDEVVSLDPLPLSIDYGLWRLLAG